MPKALRRNGDASSNAPLTFENDKTRATTPVNMFIKLFGHDEALAENIRVTADQLMAADPNAKIVGNRRPVKYTNAARSQHFQSASEEQKRAVTEAMEREKEERAKSRSLRTVSAEDQQRCVVMTIVYYFILMYG
jgi:hypothetical protein